mmetsp:Transcript_11283/g.24972  ORF Transcript_11283/g.24972 Transcript_11283/m.24972 type:complete len:228 (+) Transcript_11283:187-870(+)
MGSSLLPMSQTKSLPERRRSFEVEISKSTFPCNPTAATCASAVLWRYGAASQSIRLMVLPASELCGGSRAADVARNQTSLPESARGRCTIILANTAISSLASSGVRFFTSPVTSLNDRTRIQFSRDDIGSFDPSASRTFCISSRGSHSAATSPSALAFLVARARRPSHAAASFCIARSSALTRASSSSSSSSRSPSVKLLEELRIASGCRGGGAEATTGLRPTAPDM